MIGQRVNNYVVRDVLGEGGMGAVYLAEHPLIGRRVAIKVLRRELCEDQVLVGRFINEARAANAIRHPNIIEIIDAGELDTGAPYLVMELLEGESLGRRLTRVGRIRVGDAVEFAFQAASALSAAHAKGIVHRDLKPDNLFLIPDENIPGREKVKVLDFGIAKLRRELSGGSVKTHTGTIMGTPPYMSPEQCRGVSGDIDHRTDVYAMGIILYEMLTGAPPFVGEGFGEVLMMHMSEPPQPPRQKNPGIPEHIEKAILRALSKRREDRFGSMVEFQAALAQGPIRTISQPGIAVDPLGPTERAAGASGDRLPQAQSPALPSGPRAGEDAGGGAQAAPDRAGGGASQRAGQRVASAAPGSPAPAAPEAQDSSRGPAREVQVFPRAGSGSGRSASTTLSGASGVIRSVEATDEALESARVAARKRRVVATAGAAGAAALVAVAIAAVSLRGGDGGGTAGRTRPAASPAAGPAPAAAAVAPAPVAAPPEGPSAAEPVGAPPAALPTAAPPPVPASGSNPGPAGETPAAASPGGGASPPGPRAAPEEARPRPAPVGAGAAAARRKAMAGRPAATAGAPARADGKAPATAAEKPAAAAAAAAAPTPTPPTPTKPATAAPAPASSPAATPAPAPAPSGKPVIRSQKF